MTVPSTKKGTPVLSIAYVQNFQRLSHKNMPISQTENYFEDP